MNALATAIEDNLCAYAAFFGASSLAELNDQPSLLWVISRIPTLPFTGILRPYPTAAERANTITAAMTYFQQHHARASWIFNPMRASFDLITHLRQYQLAKTANLPGMALRLSRLQTVLPDRVTLTRVADPTMLEIWARIYAESNTAPEWICTELINLFGATPYQSEQPLSLYLGWYADQPIATAATFRTADTVGLYEVATLPAFRRQGVASKLTVQVLQKAHRQGCSIATLVSSLIAEQLYRKLGFAEQCRLVIYN